MAVRLYRRPLNRVAPAKIALRRTVTSRSRPVVIPNRVGDEHKVQSRLRRLSGQADVQASVPRTQV